MTDQGTSVEVPFFVSAMAAASISLLPVTTAPLPVPGFHGTANFSVWQLFAQRHTEVLHLSRLNLLTRRPRPLYTRASGAPRPSLPKVRMHPIHDHDPLLFLAVALAAKRRPAELVDVVAAIDLLQIAIPGEQRFVDSFARLAAAGLLIGQGEGIALTPAGLALFEALPKLSDGEERVYSVKQALSGYTPSTAEPLAVEFAAVTAAIAEHRAAAAGPARNLLVPKPKPAETSKSRPGQRQRKPMPARRKR